MGSLQLAQTLTAASLEEAAHVYSKSLMDPVFLFLVKVKVGVPCSSWEAIGLHSISWKRFEPARTGTQMLSRVCQALLGEFTLFQCKLRLRWQRCQALLEHSCAYAIDYEEEAV